MTYSTGNPIYDRGTESVISIAAQPREVLATQIENRYKVLEDRKVQGTANTGDFKGASVQGKFLKWNYDGSVIVEYNNKNYKTKPLGFTAIPKGTTVELTYVSGIYYSKW
jgi:hypothetical protein